MIFLLGVEKLRAAERQAKNNRVRLWKDYQPPTATFSGKEKDFNGVVYEIINGDAISVKSANGQLKKVFLSSIRPPREAGKLPEEADKPAPQRPKNFKPLFDIPWLFEAREFLRKKLIGKTVKCQLDYVSPARDNFAEKFCYTVTVGGTNVAEALVGKVLLLLKVVSHALTHFIPSRALQRLFVIDKMTINVLLNMMTCWPLKHRLLSNKKAYMRRRTYHLIESTI